MIKLYLRQNKYDIKQVSPIQIDAEETQGIDVHCNCYCFGIRSSAFLLVIAAILSVAPE